MMKWPETFLRAPLGPQPCWCTALPASTGLRPWWRPTSSGSTASPRRRPCSSWGWPGRRPGSGAALVGCCKRTWKCGQKSVPQTPDNFIGIEVVRCRPVILDIKELATPAWSGCSVWVSGAQTLAYVLPEITGLLSFSEPSVIKEWPRGRLSERNRCQLSQCLGKRVCDSSPVLHMPAKSGKEWTVYELLYFVWRFAGMTTETLVIIWYDMCNYWSRIACRIWLFNHFDAAVSYR